MKGTYIHATYEIKPKRAYILLEGDIVCVYVLEYTMYLYMYVCV